MYASLVTVLDGQWLQCNIEDDYQEWELREFNTWSNMKEMIICCRKAIKHTH